MLINECYSTIIKKDTRCHVLAGLASDIPLKIVSGTLCACISIRILPHLRYLSRKSAAPKKGAY